VAKPVLKKPGTNLIVPAPRNIVKADSGGTPNRAKMGTDLSPDVIDRVVYDMQRSFFRPSGEDMGPQKPGWFDPKRPIPPMAQEATYGRQFDFRAGYNLTIQTRPEENVSFFQLRGLADSYDVLRLIIETRKDQVETFQWEVRPIEDFEDDDQANRDADKATEFFQEPDRQNSFSTWMRMILEDLFVLDAVAILPRKTRGGELWGFELIDGATIQKLIDNTGRTPLPPDPAYRSILHGVPAANYTQEDIRYYMRNPRTNKVYGFGPVEQIIMTVNIAIRRQLSQLQFYTEGNIPEALASVPDGWTIDQIQQFQAYWDAMLEGNTAERRHMKFLPFDASKVKFTKDGETVLSDSYDEWLTRICCFAFSISPQPFTKQMNRATAATAQEQSKEEGLLPLLTWMGKIITRLITKDMGLKNIEFVWKMDEAVDPKTQAQIDEIYVSCEVKTPDEIRQALGMDPLTDAERAKAFPQPLPMMEPLKPGSVGSVTGSGKGAQPKVAGGQGKGGGTKPGKEGTKPTKGVTAEPPDNTNVDKSDSIEEES
jgi:hypothetical protein